MDNQKIKTSHLNFVDYLVISQYIPFKETFINLLMVNHKLNNVQQEIRLLPFKIKDCPNLIIYKPINESKIYKVMYSEFTMFINGKYLRCNSVENITNKYKIQYQPILKFENESLNYEKLNIKETNEIKNEKSLNIIKVYYYNNILKCNVLTEYELYNALRFTKMLNFNNCLITLMNLNFDLNIRFIDLNMTSEFKPILIIDKNRTRPSIHEKLKENNGLIKIIFSSNFNELNRIKIKNLIKAKTKLEVNNIQNISNIDLEYNCLLVNKS
jgi:hypothetical protein